jgi:aminopeptidase
MDVALGEVYSGVFSVGAFVFCVVKYLFVYSIIYDQTSDGLWEQLRVAGEAEYDRFWRMPLEDDYGPQIHSSNADLCNVRSVHSM